MTNEKLESIVASFEEAYAADSGADVGDFAPALDDEQYLEIVTELIRVDMELSWVKNPRKTVEEYKDLFPDVFQDEQSFDRIAFEEYRLRVASGEEITPLDYQSRFSIKAYHWPILIGTETENQELEPIFVRDKPDAVETRPPLQTRADLAARIAKGQLSKPATVESTLRGRLQLISLTFFLSLMYLAILVWFNPITKVGLFLGSPWLLWLTLVCLVVCLVVTVFLWTRQHISISNLRVLELVLFGSLLSLLSCGLASDLFIDHELARPIREGEHALFHYASSWSLPFFALIVAYGTLVPSGWRRCTIIVSIIAILPIAICTVAVISLHEFTFSFFQSFLLQMVIWMATAAAIAIYGVRRLEETQKQLSKSGRLGKYRLISQIAIGGMGVVYLAEHAMLNRRCAIKLMHPNWSLHPQLLARFEREVQVLAGISHPNVVQVHDFGFTNEGTFYYVMEFLEGKTLEQAVFENGPLAPKRAIEVLSQLAEALNEIHRGEIIHRDVKPGNIFLSKSGGIESVKLLDFGLIKSVSSPEPDQQITQDGAIVGTPAYMSPEQASGSEVDHRTDIYSLGAVAYFALTGKHVFERATAVETLTAHIKSEPPPLPEDGDPLLTPLQDILSQCLAKDPGCRIQSAAELAKILQNVDT